MRAVGEALGLPRSLVWRQPFPGPGLAVRCLGEVTRERLETLREADAIFTEELEHLVSCSYKKMPSVECKGHHKLLRCSCPSKRLA